MAFARYLKTLGLAAVVSAAFTGPAGANDFAAQILDVLNNQIRTWTNDPVVVDAVKARNAETGGLSDGDIDTLDKQWRAEASTGSGPLIDSVLANKLSAFLKEKKAASDGLYAEIFVMDAKGLNVGQSDITSDYMQGDEDKWQKTYLVGPDAVFIDDVEFDDSSGQFQSQVNATIADPATGQPIGAITIGINVEKLN